MASLKLIMIAFLVALIFMLVAGGECQDSTSIAGEKGAGDATFIGLPVPIAAAIIGFMALIFGQLMMYFLVYRRQLRQKDKELELAKQNRVIEREVVIEEQKSKASVTTTVEERYLDYLYQRNRWLNITGLKTKVPVSVDLKSVYVPLKIYKRSDRMWEYEVEPRDESDVMEHGGDISRRMLTREVYAGKERIGIETILKDKKYVVLLGGPGSGKTTFLRYLALSYAQRKQKEWLGIRDHKIPIFLSCRELDPDRLPLATQIHEWCLPDMAMADDAQDFLRKNLEAGTCLIILDGLSEVATLKGRLAVIKWIRELTGVFHKNQFIVTSRIMGYEPASMAAEFSEYFLCDFDDNDWQRFIHAWYETVETTLKGRSDVVLATAKRDAYELTRAIRNNDRIRRLTGIPLLLSIIAVVHRYDGRLPENSVKLYQDCVDLLLGGKDEAIGFPLQFDSARKLVVLKPLAYFMHSKPTRILDRDELVRQISPDLARAAGENVNADDFVEEVRMRSGLLVERGQGVLGFSHLTFQEYLTALYLKDQANTDDILISHKDDPWWRETILLYCGMVSDITPFISRLLECREDVLLSNLCLAGYCVGESLGVDPKIRGALSSRLFDYFWNVPFSDLTDEIMKALKSLAAHDGSIVAKFSDKAKDESVSVRGRAASALGQVGGEAAVGLLVGLLKDTDSSVRENAAAALGEVGGEAAVVPLVGLLKDADSSVRKSAAATLGHVGGEAVAAPLVGLLMDADSFVRQRAAEALGHVGGEAVVRPLVGLLKDTESSVRGNAAEALGRVATDTVVGLLMGLLKDTDSFVRGRAAWALGKVGGEAVVEQLLGLLKDPASEVRNCAADALGQIGGEAVVGPLLGLLKDKDSGVRGAAAMSLGGVGGEAAVEPLARLLKDTDIVVRIMAAWALGKVGGDAVVGPLVGFLKDTEVLVRGSAARALSKIGSSKIVDGLADRIDAQDESGLYICFTSLFGSLKKQKLYIDQLPAEVIERNAFWKENLKKNPVC